MTPPYPRTWWVTDALLAGPYPGDQRDTEARAKLNRLLRAGIRRFVSLQEPEEASTFVPYSPTLKRLAAKMRLSVECVNFPIPDNGIPSSTRMREILRCLDTANRPTYLHCWGGHGRTGTVIGCWLRERGLSGPDALKAITDLRRHDPYLAAQPSPQTPGQRNMVLRWIPAATLARAQGCLLGQLAGDALGSLVEFCSPGQIRARYPGGVRLMEDGGTWNTIAGQPTDDSEMALALARMLVRKGTYDATDAKTAYRAWLNSRPFDCGATTASGLRGNPNHDSQANGAMMRISPLGIFGAMQDLALVGHWARQDAALTHPNPVCQQANALFAMALALAIRTGPDPASLFGTIKTWANDMAVERPLMKAITDSAKARPRSYVDQQGWVLIALQNALWQLLHAPSLEQGIIDTVHQGGDTDTNAAIAGALLGALQGRDAIPEQWLNALMTCRPQASNPSIKRPRPECFWPIDANEVAEQLIQGPSA